MKLTAPLLTAALAFCLAGCAEFQPPWEDDEAPQVFPERVQEIISQADLEQSKGELRQAIDTVERGLVDYPDSSPLRVRLAELRSQRQVLFVTDWNEVDSLLRQEAPSTALDLLRRIQKYGDPDMIRRAREREGEIHARYPQL